MVVVSEPGHHYGADGEHRHDSAEDVQDAHVDLVEGWCGFNGGHDGGTFVVPSGEVVSVLGNNNVVPVDKTSGKLSLTIVLKKRTTL